MWTDGWTTDMRFINVNVIILPIPDPSLSLRGNLLELWCLRLPVHFRAGNLTPKSKHTNWSAAHSCAAFFLRRENIYKCKVFLFRPLEIGVCQPIPISRDFFAPEVLSRKKLKIRIDFNNRRTQKKIETYKTMCRIKPNRTSFFRRRLVMKVFNLSY